MSSLTITLHLASCKISDQSVSHEQFGRQHGHRKISVVPAYNTGDVHYLGSDNELIHGVTFFISDLCREDQKLEFRCPPGKVAMRMAFTDSCPRAILATPSILRLGPTKATVDVTLTQKPEGLRWKIHRHCTIL